MLSAIADGQPLSPENAAGFGSPILQIRAKPFRPDAGHQAFPLLPQAAAAAAASGFSPRINPSFSANDIPSLNQAAAAAAAAGSPKAAGPPQRSSSMIFTPGSGPSSQPPPQPTGAPLRAADVVGQPAAALDGFEPLMFPGIVNRRRAMSVAQAGPSDGEGPQGGGRAGNVAGQAAGSEAGFDAVEEEEGEEEEDSDSSEE
jgi:AMP deaminase